MADFKTFYDALKADGAEVPEYSKFKSFMEKSYHNRRQVYDALKADGANVPSYEVFAKNLFVPKSVDTLSKTTALPKYDAFEPEKKTTDEFIADVNNTLAENRTVTNRMEYAKSKNPLGGKRVTLGVKDNTPKNVLKTKDGYITSAGNEYQDSGTAAMEQTMIDYKPGQKSLERQLEEAYAERDRLDKELENTERKESPLIKYNPLIQGLTLNGVRVGQFVGKGMNEVMNWFRNDDYSKLSSASRALDDRIRLLEAKRDGNLESWGFWRGVSDTLRDPSTYSFGVSDFADQLHLHDINEKQEKGEKLTASELSLLNNTFENNTAQGLYGNDAGFMYRAGGITGAMIPFVGEFMLSGGFTGVLGKRIAHGILKAGMKKALKGSAELGAKKAFLNSFAGKAIKYTGITAGDLFGAAVMANTTGAGRTASDILKRKTGEVVKDDDGNFTFDGGVSTAEAIYKGEVSNMLEYYTEMLGGHINLGRLGKVLPKGTKGKIAGLVAGSPRLSKLSDVFTYAAKTNFVKDARAIMSKGGLQEYPTEVLEEEANIVLNSVFVGDNSLSDLVDGRTQADIWGGMLLSLGTMQALPFAAGVRDYYKKKSEMNKLTASMSSVFSDINKWESIKQEIDNTTNKDMASVLVKHLNDNSLTEEEKKAVQKYVGKMLLFRGFNVMTVAKAKEKVSDNTEETGGEAVKAEQDKSFAQGYETPQEEQGQTVAALKAAEDALDYKPGFDESRQFKADVLEYADDPISGLEFIAETYGSEQVRLAEAYYNMKARAEGVSARVSDDIDLQVEDAKANVDKNAYRSNGEMTDNVVEVTDGQKKYYVVGGQMEVTEGHASFAEDAVVLRDAETGDLKVTSMGSLEVAGVFSREQLRQEKETELRASLQQEADARLAAEVAPQEEPPAQEQTEEKPVEQEAVQAEAAATQEEAPTKFATIDGRKDYVSNATAEEAFDELVKDLNGSKEDAATVADGMVKNLEASIGKLQEERKAALASGVDGIAKAKEIETTIGQLQGDVEKWKKVVESSQKGAAALPKITHDEAISIIEEMERRAEPAPEIELTIENWDSLFGKDGKVTTPLGEVKMGENQFTKLMRQGRNGKLGMIKPTLENPDVIIEDASEAKDGDVTERSSSYIFVKAFKKKDGSRYYYFTSVTVSKEGKEVVVSNQEKRKNAIANLLSNGNLVWKHADDVSAASDIEQGLYSLQGNVSDLTSEGTDAPQTNILESRGDATSSESKVTDKSEKLQEKGKKSKEDFWEKDEKELRAQAERAVDDEPMDIFEFVARELSGMKITPESYREETGYGNEEMRRLVGLIAGASKGGVSIKKAAEIIYGNYIAEVGGNEAVGQNGEFNGVDVQAVEAAILDVLQSGNPRSYAKASRAARVNRMVDAMKAERDAYYQEAYHMDYADYVEYEEEVLPLYYQEELQIPMDVKMANLEEMELKAREYENNKRETGGNRPVHSERSDKQGRDGGEHREGEEPSSGEVHASGRPLLEGSSRGEVAEEAPAPVFEKKNSVSDNTTDTNETRGKSTEDSKQSQEESEESSEKYEELSEIEDRWTEKIDDYIAAHYPHVDGVRSRTAEEQALYDAELAAMKEDKTLAKMRADAKAEFDVADTTKKTDIAETKAKYHKKSWVIENPTDAQKNLTLFTNVDNEALEQKEKQAIMEGGLILTLESAAGNTHDGLSSVDKGTKKNVAKQEKSDKKDTSSSEKEITDVGEKIGGAKKDLYKETIDRAKVDAAKTDNDLLSWMKNLSASKIFNFDIAKLRAGGLSNEAVTFIQFVKSYVPAKPRTGWKLNRWFGQALSLYRLCLESMVDFGKVDMVIRDESHRELFAGYQAMMAIGGFDSGLHLPKGTTLRLCEEGESMWSRDKGEVSIAGKFEVRTTDTFNNFQIYDTYEEAVEALKKLAGQNAVTGKKEMQFNVYGRKSDGTCFITPKGKSDVIVADGFKNSTEAFDYIREHNAELQERYRTIMEGTTVKHGENRERKGRNWRDGKDVSAEDFMKAFGLRGVEFGNWMKQEDRAKALNECYDALMDLADVCGVSPQSLSLDGKLGMAFGARGGGKANAHYEPDKNVINLTKTKGAGALAHEWFHAMDAYFARMGGAEAGSHATSNEGLVPKGLQAFDTRNGKVYWSGTQQKYLTEAEYKEEIAKHPVRKEMAEAWKHLIDAITKSDYGKRSQAYATLHGGYWNKPTEMGARAFSVWVENELSKRNATNDYLANNPALLEEALDDEQKKYAPYPFNTDAEWMDEAFGNLFSTMQEKVDAETGNHVLYQKSEGAKPVTKEEAVLRDAVIAFLKGSGMDVITDVEAGQMVLDMANGKARLSAKQKRALETASLGETPRSLTVVSSANGAKVLKDIDNLISEYEKNATQPKTFIGDVAKALGAERHGSKSEYVTFETRNGKIVTIRLADHNAKVSTFDNHGELDGISIVVSPKSNEGIINDGNAHVTEYFYDAIKLRRAEGKPLAEIVKSIKQALYSGEFKDTTGLAEPQEVNVSLQTKGIRFFRTASGEAYGFTVGGKIFIDPRIATSETPVHEYAHLWASALRAANPEEWKNVVSLMKGTSVWNEVKERYPELKTDDEIADEVLAQYSGRRGAERLREEARKIAEGKGSVLKKADAMNALNNVRKALAKFWKGVCDFLHIHYTSAEEVADRVMKDLLDGVDPRKMGEVEGREFHSVIDQMFDDEHFDNSQHQRERYSLGKTPDWMKSVGINGDEFSLSFKNIKVHRGKDTDHNLTKEEWHELPKAIKNPFIVTRYKGASDRFRLYVNIYHDGKPVAVGVDVKRVNQGKNKPQLEVNSIKTVFAYNGEISASEELVTYDANITPGQEALLRELNFHEYPTIQELSAAKVVESFENPNTESQKSGIRMSEDAEIKEIIAKAKADGTYMKAPNGKPTNLNERQWAQVRTKAFKKWFGDWLKAARIEKLRKSDSIEITGEEVTPSDDLKQYKKNALEYGKSLRGEYTNKDTGAKIQINAQSIKEVLHHDYKDVEHLQSVAAIPQMIENGIFIDSLPNEETDKNSKVKEYQYYICGLRINGVDYTVKFVVAIDGNGNRYYDHKLTQIEKGKLLNELDRITSPSSREESALSDNNQEADTSAKMVESVGKDTRLISILQTNSSKIVDENGEPRVMFHGSDEIRNEFKMQAGSMGHGAYFTSNWEEAAEYSLNRQGIELNDEEEIPWDDAIVTEVFLNVKDAANITHSRYYREDVEVLATRPNQIKSATDNIGTFDANNNDIRFQFVGEKGAANADHAEEVTTRIDNLKVAREMEEAKKDAKAIKMATGWERGADGKWRYEIGDAKIVDEKDFGRGYKEKRDESDMLWTEGKLGDVVDAPDLLKAYPELKDVRIVCDELTDDQPSNGSYNPKTKTITIHATELKYLNSLLNHEIQHAIQEIEGFAQGGSTKLPSLKETPEYKAWEEQVARLREESSEEKELNETIAEYSKEYNELFDRIETFENSSAATGEGSADLLNRQKKVLNELEGTINELFYKLEAAGLKRGDKVQAALDSLEGVLWNLYKRLAGEVESRNVEKRMGMTPEERRASLASKTEDVAREDQIFLFGEGGESHMGTRTNKHMAEIGAHYEGKTLTDEEQAIVDVFSGVKKRASVTFTSNDSRERRMEFAQGTELKAGTRHAIMRHYENGDSAFTAADIMNISETLSRGNRAENGDKIIYSYNHSNGTEYTVVAEKDKGKENFVTFYTNRKASDSGVSYTQLSAHANLSDASDVANVGRNSETASDEDDLFRTSDEIDAEYPNWLEGTTNDNGKHTTQVAGTIGTYRKVGAWIESNLSKDAKILDASSGMGLGTKELREQGFNIEDVEPYQSEERKASNPATYSSYGDIEGRYDFIISNAVLNVIPDNWRRDVLHDMAARLKDGGKLFINTRKAGEEKSIKDKIELDSPQEVLVKRNGRIASYQRFFTPQELKQWVADELGDGFTVEVANEKNSGTKGLAAVVVTKEVKSEVSQMEQKARKLAELLHLDNIDFVPDGSAFEGKKAHAKGWYSRSTGRITVVVGNHTSVGDIMQTVLHEAVAHYGLRKMFGEHFDNFLDNVYNNADEKVRKAIDTLAEQYNGNKRTATEEYLASLAEDTNFEEVKGSSWWQSVKKFFMDMLRALGFDYDGPALSDNELRYILWRSFENLRNGGPRGIFAEAEDIENPKKGNENISDDGIMFRDPMKVAEAVAGRRKASRKAYDVMVETHARELYERRVKSGYYQMQEALQDSMLGLKALMEAIEQASGQNRKIEDIGGAQNPYLGENRLSSVNQREQELFLERVFKPLLKEIAHLAPTEEAYQQLVEYMFAKHGLERNRVMAERDAQREYEQYRKEHPEQDMEEVNRKFNEQLDSLTEENADSVILSLGRSSAILQSAGIPERDIRLYGNKVMKKAAKHGYAPSDLKDLPRAVQEPVAVFKGSYEGSFSLLTEISMGGNNVLVSIDIEKGEVQDINLVTSVYGKKKDSVLSWIADDKMVYCNKEKALDYISSSAPIADATYNQELSDAAKLVESFNNPKLSVGKKAPIAQDMEEVNRKFNEQLGSLTKENADSVIFSLGRPSDVLLSAGVADKPMKLYGNKVMKKVRKHGFSLAELRDLPLAVADPIAVFDNLGREGNRSVLTELHTAQGNFLVTIDLGKDGDIDFNIISSVFGKGDSNILDWIKRGYATYINKEKARTFLSHQSALIAATAANEELSDAAKLVESFNNPKLSVGKYADKDKALNYLYLSAPIAEASDNPGLSAAKVVESFNNPKLPVEKNLNYFISKYRGRDYSGLTALTETSDVAAAEAMAERWVESYEKENATEVLWDSVRKATGEVLRKQYESGLVSEESYNQVRGMYEYYIPLRGWSEETGSDVYAYLSASTGAFSSPIKTAKGRTSLADDPIATIANMMDCTIVQGNRNRLVRLPFLNYIMRNPSDLVSVSELWLQRDSRNGEWRPVVNDRIGDSDSGEEIERKTREFDDEMERLAAEHPDLYTRAGSKTNIPYKVLSQQLTEHQVLVKRNGRVYILTVNGNPRAAQAVNGLSNPDLPLPGFMEKTLKPLQWINRQLSALYTTRNPDFVASNYARDILYSGAMMWVKEKPAYAARFNLNCSRFNPARMGRLFARYENGTLDTTDETERLFRLFMENGGETGYVNLRDMEAQKKFTRGEIEKLRKGVTPAKVWELLGDKFDLVNRSVENSARFAAFVTSMEEGRSVERAVWDAKEVSVNFNKKGSGGRFAGAVGQTMAGDMASIMSAYGRGLFVFWNAAIQGTTNFGKYAMTNPRKGLAGMAALFLLGMVMAAVGSGDGDDDYYNLPDYVRRSNLCFSLGGAMITVPLPVEARALYGLGELCVSLCSGKEKMSDGELAMALAGQVSQCMPLDFLEGGGGWNAFLPSAVKPVVEAYTNKGWTGLPIYKDTPFNENEPEWTKAYKSANHQLVHLAKWVNEATGGNDVKGGYLDINPSQVEYVLKGYFGGYATQSLHLVHLGETVLGDREFAWQDVPLMNRLVKSADERTRDRRMLDTYYIYKEEAEETRRQQRRYRQEATSGRVDAWKYARYLDYVNRSPESRRLEVFEVYDKAIEDLTQKMKDATEWERPMLEAEITARKRELVEAMETK